MDGERAGDSPYVGPEAPELNEGAINRLTGHLARTLLPSAEQTRWDRLNPRQKMRQPIRRWVAREIPFIPAALYPIEARPEIVAWFVERQAEQDPTLLEGPP